MRINHVLKNTGTKTIDTDVYNHNFFIFDNSPIDSNLRVIYPKKLTADFTELSANNTVAIEGSQIRYLRGLSDGERELARNVTGVPIEALSPIISKNIATGAQVTLSSDKPFFKSTYWSDQKSICPEPFIEINLKPNESFEWNLFYEFAE